MSTPAPAPVAREGATPGHKDRCWLPAERKRRLRELEPGEIGLAHKATPPTPKPTKPTRDAA